MNLIKVQSPNLFSLACLLAAVALAPLSAAAQTSAEEKAFEAAGERGYAMQKQGRFREAIQYYEQALALLPRVANSPNSDTLLNNLADLYAADWAGNNADRAEELYQAALKLRIRRYGPTHRLTLRTLGSMANLCVRRNACEEATKRYRQLLGLQRQVFPAPSAEIAETIRALGGIESAQDRHQDAQPLLAEALSTFEAALGPDNPRLWDTLNQLAVTESALGHADKADRLLARSLAIAQNVPEGHSRHRKLTVTYRTMSALARHAGRYADAETALRAVLEICKNSPELVSNAAGTALDLGSLYAGMGLYGKAAAAYKESAELARKWEEKSPVYEILLAHNWGTLYSDTGNYIEAENLLHKARELSTALYGSRGEKTLAVLNNLGVLYMLTERWDDAESAFRDEGQALASTLGADHPRVARALANLGDALLRGGDDDDAQARECYERALTIDLAKLGGSHPHTIHVMNLLAQFHFLHGQYEKCLNFLNQARRGTRQHIHRVLAGLSPSEQLLFLTHNDGSWLTSALSIAAAQPDQPAMRDSAAEWVLNSKGVAQEALSQRAREARNASDPRAAKRIEDLQSVRRRLIELRAAAARPASVPSDVLAKTEALVEREKRLEAELSTISGLAYRADAWVEITEVRQALPPHTVLVELAKTQLFDLSRVDPRAAAPTHYLAWVAPPLGAGDVRMVDLGPAEPIEAAVAEARAMLEAAPAAIQNDGHQAAERASRAPLAALSRLTLEPLLPYLGDADRIALSPDASLWLAPWCALVLPDGRYAIEKYEITYLISGRDLVNVATPLSTSRPVIFADPDYNLGSAEAQAATQQVLRKAPGVSRRSADSRKLTLRVDRLPGTAEEAKLIAPSLEEFAHTAPQVYTDRWALEGVCKALRQPRVLVTSTHGFFLPDQVVLQQTDVVVDDARRAVLDQTGARIENPLLRCGLLLAGCNQAADGAADDGVLTGLEITAIDLRGTELVVLSACQTGIGDLHRGEGVAGLRQAFQLAGAQAVVATLWQIDDSETVSLMSELFKGLAAGQTKSAALRAAQLKRIAALRDADQAAHAYYWAAFTLTGH